ncbi:Uncharacterised protein [Klebsiella pneumoniae]|nr:Uncharacterised protein [Klebsiella pneumoniae]
MTSAYSARSFSQWAMVQENCASQSINNTQIFFPCNRAAWAVKCSITVESFPPEKETQMREKLSMTHWIRCSVACSTDSGKGYLINDMTINPLIVENSR